LPGLQARSNLKPHINNVMGRSPIYWLLTTILEIFVLNSKTGFEPRVASPSILTGAFKSPRTSGRATIARVG
jgi:hypothetical protein